MLNKVCYVTVYVRDFQRAVEFYEKTLGMTLAFADEGFGFASFDTEGVRFTVARVDASNPNSERLVGRHSGVALGAPDIHAAYEELASRGVTFVQPPEKQPWGGTIALFADPDGNVITLDEDRAEG